MAREELGDRLKPNIGEYPIHDARTELPSIVSQHHGRAHDTTPLHRALG